MDRVRDLVAGGGV
jgi:site-specific DNA recombinase